MAGDKSWNEVVMLVGEGVVDIEDEWIIKSTKRRYGDHQWDHQWDHCEDKFMVMTIWLYVSQVPVKVCEQEEYMNTINQEKVIHSSLIQGRKLVSQMG